MSEEKYTQDDPRLQPIPLAKYPWTALPSSKSKNDIVKVSIIPTSTITAPLKVFTSFTDPQNEDETEETPCWSFLLEKGDEAILWDMGLREDPENAPKKIVEGPLKEFVPHLGPGPIPRLKEHGFDLGRLKLVAFSHQHFDHYGDLDTLPSPAPPILLGPSSLESIGPGFPEDINAAWPSAWLKNYEFLELPDPAKAGDEWQGEVARVLNKEGRKRRWERVGCFDHGVDWFGDGSLWFLDTPGHCPGHLMALCRVTASPDTYILLGGDASHHQPLYLPAPASPEEDYRSPLPVISGKPQLATDPPLAIYTIGQLTRMSAEENVMVILAHEGEVSDVVDFYPDNLGRWMELGWKSKKETKVTQQAKKRAQRNRSM